MKTIYIYILFLSWAFLNTSCKKLVTIPPPQNVATNDVVFGSDDQATSAMAGIYSSMINTAGTLSFCNGSLPIYCGMSADELIPFNQTASAGYIQFRNNDLLTTNGFITPAFWKPAYSIIYACNAVIGGVSSSPSISDSVKQELVAESKFVRALCYFYLINIYGDVPFPLTADYNKTNLLPRSPQADIYRQIIADLKEIQNTLPEDYSVSPNKRIIPNKWAATALLAKIYLYQKDYTDAEIQSSQVINNSSLFSLAQNVNTVFNANNSEAIFQLEQATNSFPYNGTAEGYKIIPPNSTTPPFVYLTSTLLNAFEPGDKRRVAWVDSIYYSGKSYFIPFKYQLNSAHFTPNGSITQSYMVLRLSEQYLIRAEAEANGADGSLNAAIADINSIRSRAGLPDYAGEINKDSILSSIYHERQIELFCEWGSRWFDIKRWGVAEQILTTNKGISIDLNSLLYPIPVAELQIDPNLTQNPGYN